MALPMPISAEPDINPAHIGSMPSTQNRLPGVPSAGYLRRITQKIIAPAHIPNVDSGGSTTPRPIETAESGNRPFVTMRAISIAAAATAATIIDTTADHGKALT